MGSIRRKWLQPKRPAYEAGLALRFVDVMLELGANMLWDQCRFHGRSKTLNQSKPLGNAQQAYVLPHLFISDGAARFV